MPFAVGTLESRINQPRRGADTNLLKVSNGGVAHQVLAQGITGDDAIEQFSQSDFDGIVRSIRFQPRKLRLRQQHLYARS